jgi:hypothetical protein
VLKTGNKVQSEAPGTQGRTPPVGRGLGLGILAAERRSHPESRVVDLDLGIFPPDCAQSAHFDSGGCGAVATKLLRRGRGLRRDPAASGDSRSWPFFTLSSLVFVLSEIVLGGCCYFQWILCFGQLFPQDLAAPAESLHPKSTVRREAGRQQKERI